MQLATSEVQVGFSWDAARTSWMTRDAGRFTHPQDVVDAFDLTPDERRSWLSAWMSDASAVRDDPSLRWLIGTPAPVPLEDIREAREALDRRYGFGAPARGSPPAQSPAIISVDPLGEGWSVSCSLVSNLQVFKRGAPAEDAARRLGERLAAAGVCCEIRIHLRDGALGARFVCPAWPAAANTNEPTSARRWM